MGVLLLIPALSSCNRQNKSEDTVSDHEVIPIIVSSDLLTPSPSPSPVPELQNELRYIFLFIGDGMGPNQVLASNEARLALGEEPLCFLSFPIEGFAKTDNILGKTTDSAASCTALSTGIKTENSMLGMDPEGNFSYSFAKDLQELGWKIGILSTVSIDNATLAGFYAHAYKRTDYETIRYDLFASRYDYFASGGFHGEEDFEAMARKYGYIYTVGEDAAHAAGPGKLISVGDSLTTDRGLRLAADHGQNRDGLLARNVELGIIRMQDRPFFMMAEGGRIDLACHYHDAGDLFWEMEDFDQSIRVALAFKEKHPHETLILVTADHETGGLSLHDGDRTALTRQSVSCDSFDKVNVTIFRSLNTPFESALPEIISSFGLYDLSEDETNYLREAYEHTMKNDLTASKSKKLYGEYSPVCSAAANLVASRAGLSFSTTGHTGINVSVYATGVGSEYFFGTYENTEIHDRILDAVQELGRHP